MPPKKHTKGKKGKKGRRVKRPEDVESLAQNMTAEKMSHVNERAALRSTKWEHFDTSGRGFNFYTPDGYVASLDDVHLLIIVDHPIDYGLYNDTRRGPCSLGTDALFIEPTLNALIRVLINRMCKGNYNLGCGPVFTNGERYGIVYCV